jgi:hypothetical protein
MIEQLYLRKRPNCKSFPAGALHSKISRKKAQEAQKGISAGTLSAFCGKFFVS